MGTGLGTGSCGRSCGVETCKLFTELRRPVVNVGSFLVEEVCILPDLVHVLGKVAHLVVLAALELVLHRAEVHGVLDNLRVRRELEGLPVDRVEEDDGGTVLLQLLKHPAALLHRVIARHADKDEGKKMGPPQGEPGSKVRGSAIWQSPK